MRQKLLVPITVVLLVLTGLWGQYLVSPERLSADFSTSLYQIMMLFILDGDWTVELERVPLQLEIVRFLAPLVLFASLLLVFAKTARVSLANATASAGVRNVISTTTGPKISTCARVDAGDTSVNNVGG